jgi:hypothetical protein
MAVKTITFHALICSEYKRNKTTKVKQNIHRDRMHDKKISTSTVQRIICVADESNKPPLSHLLSASVHSPFSVTPNAKGGLTDAPHNNVDTSPSIHLIDFDAINCSSPAPMIDLFVICRNLKINAHCHISYKAGVIEIQSHVHILEGNLEIKFLP